MRVEALYSLIRFQSLIVRRDASSFESLSGAHPRYLRRLLKEKMILINDQE